MSAISIAAELSRSSRSKRVVAACALTLLLAGCGHREPKMNPPPQGKTENVKLVWKQATNEWKVQLNGGSEMNPKTAKTTIPAGEGPVMFVIDIAGQGATFKDPDGLSVWTGPKTVPAPPGINSAEIVGPIITKSGKMIFWDLNQGSKVTLNYALHFTNKPSVDPIIDNGGGKEF